MNATSAFSPEISKAVEDLLDYLKSEDALKSIRRDPYWPKWNSPWWHMLLLHEMDLASRIPQSTIRAMVDILKTHYLPVFPIQEEEFPAGTDPYRQVACHCALGSIYQVLFAAGIDVDQELALIRPWFLKYQMPDGGLNCDDAVYRKETPKSSIVSSLPPLEAVLLCTNRPFTESELQFLDRGAQYLLDHRLFRRKSNGEVIDPEWLEAKFPRYYEYDFLRGYAFLARWAKVRGRSLPDSLVDEVEELVGRQMAASGIELNRFYKVDTRSYNPTDSGAWQWGDASWFALHEAVSGNGIVCPFLTAQWNDVRPQIAIVNTDYEVVYADPIKVNKSETLSIERWETDPEWLGWAWCVAPNGKAGWISNRYFEAKGTQAVMLRDYEATELAVRAGERVKIYYEEAGWAWCKNARGLRGWVPSRNLVFE